MAYNVAGFSELCATGIKKIYELDTASQQEYISLIATKIRKIDPKIIYKANGIFVPNSEYLLQYFGVEAMSPDYDLYNEDGTCIWHNYLVVPVRNVSNTIVGLAGFNPVKYLEAKESKDWSITYYSYSQRKIFNKGDYLFMLPDTYKKAINSYLIITDGFFDTLHLASYGYNAAALLGSAVSDTVYAMLRFVNRVILVSDNDDAGLQLEKKLKKHLNNVIVFQQNKTKDVDDILKTGDKEDYLKQLDTLINSELPIIKLYNSKISKMSLL